MEISAWAKNNPNPAVMNTVFLLCTREKEIKAIAKATVVMAMNANLATYAIKCKILNTSS